MKLRRIGYVAMPGFNETELCEMQAVLGIHPQNRSTIVGTTQAQVTGQHGMTFVPDATFADCPDLDVIVIADIPEKAQDDVLLHDYLKHQVNKVSHVLASGGGVMALAKAGLLSGVSATSDDFNSSRLANYGAVPVMERRAVKDGKFFTAGRSTGMIEAAFQVQKELRGQRFTKFAELTLEYDPQLQFPDYRDTTQVDFADTAGPVIAVTLPDGSYIPDVMGAVEVLSAIPGATLHVVSHDMSPVQCLLGPKVTLTTRFEDCPQADFIVTGATLPQRLSDPALLAFLQKQAPGAKGLISVCAGTLIYAAAGLLDGKTATSNFHHTPLLKKFGVTPSGTEVVSDGKFYSAGPAVGSYEVSLRAVQDVYGVDVAAHIEHAVLQYAPNPVFGVGNPEKATGLIRLLGKYLFLPTLPIYQFFGNRGLRLMRQ